MSGYHECYYQRGVNAREARNPGGPGQRLETLANVEPYGVIYADPPWRFKPMFKGAVYENDQEVHYPTMSLDDICALPVPAAKSAVLYLWVTSPHLEQGLRVVREWGFAYRSSAVWVKPWPRTGYWWRNQHEHLLVANRGKWPAPKPRDRAASLYEFPTTRHSEKPARVREQIASWWPDARRLELFARHETEGWDTWGNEAPSRSDVNQMLNFEEPA